MLSNCLTFVFGELRYKCEGNEKPNGAKTMICGEFNLTYSVILANGTCYGWSQVKEKANAMLQEAIAKYGEAHMVEM